MSLYFSAPEYWRAADSNSKLTYAMLESAGGELVANYPSYVAEKVKYAKNGGLNSTGVYSQASFNNESGEEVGYMTYQREYNEMYGGYDKTAMVSFDESIIGSGFLDYLNEFASKIKSKKADIYYGFVPVNELAVESEEKAETYCNYLKSNLNFPLLGHQGRYVMDYEWFYDNNVHMNSYGMYNYSYLLCEDLKVELNDTTPISFSVPEKPEVPVTEVEDGNNTDADCFTYEVQDESVVLTGLTEEGLERTTIVIPTKIEGLPVVSFLPSVFAGDTTISEIYVPSSIRVIEDYSFNGCTRLSKLIIEHETLTGLSTGTSFLEGADKCYVYVNSDIFNDLVNGCGGGWEVYKSRLKSL
jgi:hypothetical protein